MSKINFQAMDRKALKAYVLSHREDEEAFSAYIDKLHAEGNWVNMPSVSSVEDLDKHPDFLKKVRENHSKSIQ